MKSPLLKVTMVICVAALGVAVRAAHAQDYPTKPISIVAGSTAGGGFDVMARMLQPYLSKTLGQPIVVENKPGAATLIATENVARSAPDGYRLLIAHEGAIVINPFVYKDKLTFDPKADLAPIGALIATPMMILVRKDAPYKTLAELVSYAKANPGKINAASGGNVVQLSLEYFKSVTGTDVNRVNYPDSFTAANAVARGEADMTLADLSSTVGLVKSNGGLVALAIAQAGRSPLLPDVPTTTEAGVAAYQHSSWIGLFAPAKTPQPILAKLEAAVQGAIRDPDTRERFAKIGTMQDGSRTQLQGFIDRDYERWSRLIKERNIVLAVPN